MTRRKTTLSKTAKPKRGPSELLVKAFIHRIALGETLAQCCRDDGTTSEAAVRRRINQSSSLRSAYACAREARLERMADELLEIAEDGTNDWMTKAGRNGTFVALNEEHVRRSQLRIDTRKWLLSKLLPARFGEHVEHTGAGGGPIQHEHALSAKMLANLDVLRSRLPSLPVHGGVDTGAKVIDVTPNKG